MLPISVLCTVAPQWFPRQLWSLCSCRLAWESRAGPSVAAPAALLSRNKASSQIPGARTLLYTLIRSSGASKAVHKFRREPVFGTALLEPSTTTHQAQWPPLLATATLDGTKAPGEVKPQLSRQPGQSLGQRLHPSRQPGQSLEQRLHAGNGTTWSALPSQPTKMPT